MPIFSSVCYINAVKNRNEATKMVIFNLFCIKIQFYHSKIIHTLFMHKNKNANVTTKSRMWHWHFEIPSMRMADKNF